MGVGTLVPAVLVDVVVDVVASGARFPPPEKQFFAKSVFDHLWSCYHAGRNQGLKT